MVSGDESARIFGGRYRLLELLGEGADAQVYAAEDLTLRRRVAIKILRQDLAGNAGFQRRFEQEMRAVSTLNFPRLLPVYDWGLHPAPHLVTEPVAGNSLAAMIDAGHRLTPSQALVVGLEAARALANIHGAGRAHLGLTPSSILFDSAAGLFISDLGLAPALAEASLPQPDSDEAGSSDVDADEARAREAGANDAAAREVDEGDAAAVGVDAAGSGAGEVDATGSAAVGVDADESGAGFPTVVRYTAADKSRDVYDLASVLKAAVTGISPGAEATPDEPVVSDGALGPLHTVIEQAAAVDPADRLDASSLVQELLRVAGMLSRPEPLPVVAADKPLAPSVGEGTVPLRPDEAVDGSDRVGAPVWARAGAPLDDAPRHRWPGIALAVVLVLAGAGAGLRAWIGSRLVTDPVPNLVGQSRTAAADAVADLGWEVIEVLVREPGTERGDVVGTDPTAGTALGNGAVLEVFVSLGEPLVTVHDDLFGFTVRDASDELAGRGLVAGAETIVNDELVPPGLVVGLDLADGVYELEVGSEVDLLVSSGPADRTVPEVPGDRELLAAREALLAARLVPVEVRRLSTDVPVDSVIGFLPPSGRTVPADSVVEMLISLGPPPELPDEAAESSADETPG